MDTVVQSYYDQNAENEWERFERHRTEYAVTLRALHDFLPPAPATVLDVGGGPGRYAIALAKQGYDVTLVDLSRECLKLAKEKAHNARVRLVDTIHADACDLSTLSSERFDAVLLMGPLYHLLTYQERLQAVREARRVLKPQGMLFASFISRFAPMRDAAARYPESVLEHAAHIEQELATGVLNRASTFTNAYFALPDDIVPFMEATGTKTLTLIGCEGIVAGHEQKINDLQGKAWDYWVDLNYRLGKDAALRGAADHLLYVGRMS
jgi:2-polyprenyl-3-methyl-5-hydroxy-6-metoxy-1,4-benzoquinol methylase